MVNVGGSNNRFSLTGSPLPASTTSPTENIYVQKNISWGTRTNVNDIVVAQTILNTGASSTSKNEFIFGIYNTTRLKALVAFRYLHSTNVLNGLVYDSTGTTSYGNYTHSTIATGNTALTLLDNTDYLLRLYYDINSGTSRLYVALNSSPNTAIADFSLTSALTSDVALLVLSARAGTSNASSTSVQFDNISVDARPCLNYTTIANSNFSYASGSHCLGTANLSPVLVDVNATGTFTSTPAGLTINPTTGVIDLGIGVSTAGNYTIKFVANNACVDSIEIAISLLNCAGIEEIATSVFTIYPNPAKDIISITELKAEDGIILFYAADGKLIEARKFNNSPIETFDVKSLNSGIYFILIGEAIQKVVIE